MSLLIYEISTLIIKKHKYLLGIFNFRLDRRKKIRYDDKKLEKRNKNENKNRNCK